MPELEIPDGPTAAEQMIASLTELEPKAEPGAEGASPMDEFLSSFDPPAETVKPEETAPGTAAAEPEPEKPDETPPLDEDFVEPPPKMTAAARANWDKLQARAKEYKVKATEAEKAREEAVATRDKELETLRQQIAELPDLREKAKEAEESARELAVTRVEGTKEYKNTILVPLDTICEAADVIAKANDLDPDKLIDAISERDPAKRRTLMGEVLSGLEDVDKLEVSRMASDVQQILSKRDQIREQAFEARKELEQRTAEREAKETSKRKDSFQSSVDFSVGELSKRVPFVPLAEGETAEGVFDLLRSKARDADISNDTPASRAVAEVSKLALSRVTRQLVHSLDKIKTLEARIEEINNTRVTVGGGAESPQPDDADEADFMENISRSLGLKVSKTKLL